MFSCEYCEICKNSHLKNICERLLLYLTEFSERLLLYLTEFSERLVFRYAIFQNSLSNNLFLTFISLLLNLIHLLHLSLIGSVTQSKILFKCSLWQESNFRKFRTLLIFVFIYTVPF